MKNVKNLIFSFIMFVSIGSALLSVVAPQSVYALEANDNKCNSGFLGFPAWYSGLTNSDCSIKSPESAGGLSKFVWRIGLNVVDIALVAASYVAAFFILYGGFLFLTSQGDPTDAAQARSTMLDAVIGLAISMGAVILINFIFNGIGM